MTVMVLAAVGFGAGLCLLASGLSPLPTPLDKALARLGQPIAAATGAGDFDARMGRRLRELGPIEWAIAQMRADLRILGRDPDHAAVRIVASGLIGLVWAPFVTAGAWAIGMRLPLLIPGWLSLLGAGLTCSREHRPAMGR